MLLKYGENTKKNTTKTTSLAEVNTCIKYETVIYTKCTNTGGLEINARNLIQPSRVAVKYDS